MCRNSFGPCALECGPSTPVIMNCAPGNFSPSMPMNGIVPPSPMYIAGVPKNCLAGAGRSTRSSHGASAGRVPAGARPSRASNSTLAPYGGFASSSALAGSRRRCLRIERRRQAQRELHRGLRAQHVAGVAERRQAVGAGDRQRRAPGAVEHQLGQVVGPSASCRAGTGTCRRRRCRAPRAARCACCEALRRGCRRTGPRRGSCRWPRPRGATAAGAGCGSSTARCRTRRRSARLRSARLTVRLPPARPRSDVVHHSWS